MGRPHFAPADLPDNANLRICQAEQSLLGSCQVREGAEEGVPLLLNEREIEDLVAFLRALSAK